MGIGAILSTATSGLKVTEANLDLVARNISNADTPGYTRKSLVQSSIISGSTSSGVRVDDVMRELDYLLQAELRNARAGSGHSSVMLDFLSRVDRMYGEPGSEGAFDSVFNTFTQSVQDLVASPDSSVARQTVLADAQIFVQRLNQMSTDIQQMRTQADQALSAAVLEVNDALSQIEKITLEIRSFSANGNLPPDLLDERDRYIDRLSEMLDVRTIRRENGGVSIFTESGTLLFDGQAVQLNYDERGQLGPDSLYSTDPAQRGVGTILLSTPSGYTFDLLQDGVIRSGSIGAYATLRDDVLVEAQTQLDELASSLALALSSVTTTGTTLTAGAQSGFSGDIANMLPGDRITVNYVENGTPKTFTFIRVDDPTQLPLPATATADPNDQVAGINFAGGLAGAAAAMDAAIGANVSISLNAPSTLEVLDDGAAALSDISSLSIRKTSTALTGQGLELPFFIDIDSAAGAYSGSFDGGPQQRGFAGRISVNTALLADPSRLVVSSTSPQTGAGDPARPTYIYDQLTQTQFTFSSEGSIGTASSPFKGSIGSYLQRVVNSQTGQAAEAERAHNARTIVKDALESRMTVDSGVNLDHELAQLLVLQNSFAANARVLQAVDEMMQRLLQI
ncbi:MAG: flagellar hook-associated protein FlgK [Fimbriimonadaceae bacterium]|nr:flagellar hook-associated protein FlgK [Alphaproteobacteria bacterium]